MRVGTEAHPYKTITVDFISEDWTPPGMTLH
jgi:hypothetical protein